MKFFGRSGKIEEEQEDKTVLFVCTEDMIISADIRVNMGCMDRNSCPTLFIHNLIEWGIEDPKGKPIEKVREIRDNIEQRVRQLAADLVKDNPKINN
jgi:hypothetical protein